MLAVCHFDYDTFVRVCQNGCYNGIMNDFAYWHKQDAQGLFGEVDTFPPEQKRFAGKLLVIGGHKGAFFAVANALTEANKMGVGEVRALLPNSLRGQVPSTPEVYFAEAEASGAFGRASLNEMLVQAAWADAILLIGDLGKNAESSIVFAELLARCEKPIYMMRDAVDTVTPDAMNWSLREGETALFVTMPQLQKLLRTLYYPKVITLSMPKNQLVETLHKFTVSYEMTVGVLHNDQLLVARDGEVVSEELKDTTWTPITLWGGTLMTRAVVLRMWNPSVSADKLLATAFNLK